MTRHARIIPLKTRISTLLRSWGLRQWGKYGLLLLLSAGLCGIGIPSVATTLSPEQLPTVTHPDRLLSQSASPQFWLDQGQQRYEAGQYMEAIAALQQAIDTARLQNDGLTSIMALRNLALVYHQLGQWQAGQQAVTEALELLAPLNSSEYGAMQASILDVQGSLYLGQGQAEAALNSWEQANTLYLQTGNDLKAVQTQINQAQALQQLGFYRRSQTLLSSTVQTLEEQPASLNKGVALRLLGDALVLAGELNQAQIYLEESLAIAQQLQLPDAISAAELSLGNLWRARAEDEAALDFYQQAASHSTGITAVQAQLNQVNLLAERNRVVEAQILWRRIPPALAAWPPSQSTVYAHINLAQSLLKLGAERNPTSQEIAEILEVAIQQARILGDQRAESYALGTLGSLYERSGQWVDAQTLSERALEIAQTTRSLDSEYRWQWQLGRIYRAKAEADPTGVFYDRAIAAYGNAVDTLKILRTDLVAVNPQVQVSFQDSVEPIHREFVSLLLDPQQEASPAKLEKARDVIESLQLAELDNFFKEACLEATPVLIDQIDEQAAVIYPIVLSDRLEVIIRLPQQELRHYSSPVTQDDLETVVNQLRQSLVLRVSQQFLLDVQKLYDWIIRPIEADLAASQAQTLVFVLDGSLRNLPMAALHNGEKFLVEQYSVALTPGLQLLDPRPLQAQDLRVLTAGLSESRQGFSALPNVVPEVEQIQATVPAQVLLNQEFTESAIETALTFQPAPIVHLATHGKFSSNREETFILTWDGRLDIKTINNLLATTNLNQSGPIELLVLSACQTATGDRQAALGLAGMAVRAGARSTIATLWQVNDEATAMLMDRLYKELVSHTVTKAEALRQAQLAVLQVPEFRRHPYYWAPYVLVGNWL